MALTKVIGSGIGTVTDNVVITSDDPTITMTDSSGTNDISTIQSASGALILTARDGSSDGEIIFKKTDGSATDETLRIKNSGNIGIGTNDPATQLHIENSSGNGSLQITSSTSGTSFINMGDTGDPDDGQISYLNSDLSMRFTTNAAEQVRIHSNGVLSASDGIALGVGTANTSSNVLDDYEEGKITATCANSVTLHSNSDDLLYTKIGRQVHVSGSLRVNNSNGGSAFTVNNLPFTSNSDGAGYYTTTTLRFYSWNLPLDQSSTTNSTVNFFGRLDPDSNTIHFMQSRDAATTIVLPASSDAYIIFGMTYFTA